MEPVDPQTAKLQDLLLKYSQPLSARDRPLWIKNLLYGDYKVGKTVAAAHCGKKIHMFATDNGWSSLKDWPELAEKVTVDECQSMRHWEAYVKALVDDVPMYREFDHIIIDPFSKLVDNYIDWLQDNVKPDSADSRVTWNTLPNKKDPSATSFTTAGMGDYQAVRNYFRKQVHPLTRIPKHVTFISHLREPSYLDKVKTLRSSVPGKTHEMIAREMDLIGLVEAEGNMRTISFETNSRQDAGSRMRELHGKKIPADLLPTIYEKWAAQGELL